MKKAYKIAAKDSCNYALNKGNSNETNIKITPEIADLFGVIPNSGESFDVSFSIAKEDYLVSLCKIISSLPLYNNKGKLITFSETLLKEMLDDVNNFFQEDKIKEINAKLTKPGSHPICLNFGANNFCIRNYLVESRSVLIFTENYGKVKLNIEFRDDIEHTPIKEYSPISPNPLQQIYYGAPGTGKSHTIKLLTAPWENKDRVVRTTFHPDSDYSTFVGSYKPTMVHVPVRNNLGQLWTKTGKLIAANEEYKLEDVVTEKQISYDFVAQSFLTAYVNAWTNREEPEFLIIEEINRGNCAQIFGDLFQLLDRADSGYSDYAINVDQDMQKFLSNAFSEVEIEDYPKVKSGEQMLLPPNLFIWATMNTSDQSLFPIDSAFKRRWKWNYVKISNAYQQNEDGSFKRDTVNNRIPLGWQIKTADFSCDWWEFLQAINDKIARATISDDKKLGYFFCKPELGSINIDEDTFVGKVVFYLWNDVFKDNDTDLFKVKHTSKEPSFDDFYLENENGETVPDSMSVKQFLINVMGDKAFVGETQSEESSQEAEQVNVE